MPMKKYLIILVVSLISILSLVSFSYFISSTNNDNNQKVSIDNGTMQLLYTDCNNTSDCSDITGELEPGDSITKTFSIKNTGTLDTNFKIIFSKSNNTFVNNELTYSLYSDGTNEKVTSGTIPYGDKTNVYIYTDEIKADEIKKYKLIIGFENIESGNNESNKSANFNISLGIDVNNVWNFDYTGNAQEFVVPNDGMYFIELWGAEGGPGSADTENYVYYGGRGSYVSGEFFLDRKSKIKIYVGGKGKSHVYNNENYIQGGYNGGGQGAYDINTDDTSDAAGSGGGATDIRLTNSALSRIMVAGGGGGGAWSWSDAQPDKKIYDSSNGGGLSLIGMTLKSTYIVEINKGSQTDGYSFGHGYDATFVAENSSTAGGGGGYWTGETESDISYYGVAGPGGSSFISGHNGCVAITEDSTEDKIRQRIDSTGKTCIDGTTDITCSYHYSGYIFTNTKMIDGSGYNWTTEKGNYVGQPQPDGSIKKGHYGNGYARITYLGSK